MAGYSDYGTNRAGDPELQPPQKKENDLRGRAKNLPVLQFEHPQICISAARCLVYILFGGLDLWRVITLFWQED